jgi:hypothetical protein
MNSRACNESLRRLFGEAGTGTALTGELEPPTAPEPPRVSWAPLRAHVIIECPCGCGLQGDICPARAAQVEEANEAIGF